ncbi:hypothetical protein OO013_07695 [Mangrovivirga sp. M17]|uniref:YD repeat-containing protein n=1 Tax=Mangrovivirga halotolerans TaxID=2993936 RepID=A0ABT3RQ81_9BACT|nr:hypothetical protein [Mangrovivirga halotolerans]MCX2743742.1 hypothetical protein [Mangrovivirga halotolerans]
MKYLVFLILLANLSRCTHQDDPVIYKSFMNYKSVKGDVIEIKEWYKSVDDNGKLKKPTWEMVYSLDDYHRITSSYMRNLTIEPYDTSGRRKTYFYKDNRIDSVVTDANGIYRFVTRITYLKENKLKIINRNGKGIKEQETYAVYDKTGRPLVSNTTWYNIKGEAVSKTKDEFKYKNGFDAPLSHSTTFYNSSDQLIKKEKRIFTYGEHDEVIGVKTYNKNDSLVQIARHEQQLDDQHNPIKTTTYVNDSLNMVVEREFTYK